MGHIVMPQFGETVAEGELTRWLVAIGDHVDVDQPVAEISTDKVDTEVPASMSGTVASLLARVGDVVPVGAPLIELTSERPALRSTPRARRLAHELGMRLEDIAHGNGPITAKHVGASAAERAAAASAASSELTPAPHRQDGPALDRSHDVFAPHATWCASVEVDFAVVDRSRNPLRDTWRARHGTELTHMPYVVRAVALALGDYPRLNAIVDDDALVMQESVNIAVSADRASAGHTAVLRQVEALGLADIATGLHAATGAARSGISTSVALGTVTFALIAIGGRSNVLMMPTLARAQVAAMSIGAAVARPAVVLLQDGSQGIGIRPIGTLTLSWDPRAADSSYAAEFLSRVKELLETTAWQVGPLSAAIADSPPLTTDGS